MTTRTCDVPDGRVPATLPLQVTDATPAQDPAEMLDISVRPRRQSLIRVAQPVKKSGGVTNVIVTYTVKETVKGDNNWHKSAEWLGGRLSAV